MKLEYGIFKGWMNMLTFPVTGENVYVAFPIFDRWVAYFFIKGQQYATPLNLDASNFDGVTGMLMEMEERGICIKIRLVFE